MEKDKEQMEADVLGGFRIPHENSMKECQNSSKEGRLVSLLESLKAIERQESDLHSRCRVQVSKLQTEVEELEKILQGGTEFAGISDTSVSSFQDAHNRLNSKKKELASILRSILALKRQIHEVPSEAELTQYELRFSELNNQIQKKHGQTRKHYATYNALLEIKELVLKETSLLNSINLQFQDAITNTNGRNQLIHSLEGISNGIQQKLEKVELTLQSEEKLYNSIKDKYMAAISMQRRNSSLLRLLQDERARNERFRATIGDTLPLNISRKNMQESRGLDS